MAIRIAWVVAVTIALAVGGFIFHFPGSYGDPVGGLMPAVFGLLLAAVNGLLVGVLAAAAVRPGHDTTVRLLATMMVAVGGTHALYDGSWREIPFIVVQAAAGLVMVGAFAWRLGERRGMTLAVIGAAWTIGLVVAGWSGDRLGLPLSETPVGWSMDHAWDGLVTGLIWGTVTAAIGVPGLIRTRQSAAATMTTSATA